MYVVGTLIRFDLEGEEFVIKVMSICYVISNRTDLEGVELKPNMKGKYTHN